MPASNPSATTEIRALASGYEVHLVVDTDRPDGVAAMREQLQVFGAAADVYDDRHALRGDAWKDFPPSDLIHHLESKTARLNAMVMKLETAEGDLNQIELLEDTETDKDKVEMFIQRLRIEIRDDALDLIDYAAFLVRRTAA
jgi:hypothetical protein